MEAIVFQTLIVAIVAFISTCLMLVFARKILKVLNIVDIPNHRSSHSKVTIRGAGIAPLIGIVAASIVAVLLDFQRFWELGLILIPIVLVAMVGFIEDLRGLPMKLRLLAQLLVGLVLGWLFPSAQLPIIVWLVLVCLAFSAYVNFTNFMDGLNGISGFHGVIVGLTFSFYGTVTSMAWLQAAGMIIALSFLAFLPANFKPPGMFLGDVGSYLLGGSVVTVGIAAYTHNVQFVALLAPVSIYLADTIFTILRRLFSKEPIFEAHRSHVYQRLNLTGLTHLKVSLLVGAFTLVAAFIGLLTLNAIIPSGAALLLLLLVCLVYISMPKMMRRSYND